jgi:hypothetical protein
MISSISSVCPPDFKISALAFELQRFGQFQFPEAEPSLDSFQQLHFASNQKLYCRYFAKDY